MSIRSVRALLAAGVENPALIARWRDQPHLLRDYDVDPAAVDLDALWKFAGMTIKLRHKTLRDELPSTFRLISVAGLELELFAAYASDRAARNATLATHTDARILELIAFLDGWLDRSKPTHGLVWDLVRHEQALARFGKTAPAVGSSPRLPAVVPHEARGRAAVAPISATVPRVTGEIILHEMSSDPRAITRALHTGTPALETIARAPGHLCYWRAEGSPQIAIVQLDPLGFRAVSLIDGKRTVAALAREVEGTARPGPALLRLLAELATVGLLSLSPPS
jgi:hypothetical protein